MLHCISTCCGSTLMRSEIHTKHSSPTQSLCSHVPGALQEVSQSRLHAGGSWSLDQGQAPALLQHWGVLERPIRHWPIHAHQLSQMGIWGSWALSPWSKTCWELSACALCLAPSEVCGPNKALKNLQKCSCYLHKSKTLHRKSYILFHKHRHLQLIKLAAYNYTLSY